MEFDERVKSGVTDTSIWFYFLRGKQNRGIAKCVKCSKVIKCEGSSTSGMKTHLRGQHGITLNKRAASPVAESEQPSTSSSVPKKPCTVPKQTNIPNYFSKVSRLEVVLARMAAKDGFSFRAIAKSEDIRLGLLARGFDGIPQTHEGIRQKVKSYYDFVVKDYRQEFAKKTETRKFSLTFDEWTSNRNRRYMNINVHDKDQTWNLGLRRIIGSMNAENCISLLETHLHGFTLSLSDFMAMTTDGPFLMLKVGRLLKNVDHQVCLAHGVHLAVVSVLYQRDSNKTEGDESFSESEGKF